MTILYLKSFVEIIIAFDTQYAMFPGTPNFVFFCQSYMSKPHHYKITFKMFSNKNELVELNLLHS